MPIKLKKTTLHSGQTHEKLNLINKLPRLP